MRMPTMQQLEDDRFKGWAMGVSKDELLASLAQMERAINIFRKDNSGYKRKANIIKRELRTRN